MIVFWSSFPPLTCPPSLPSLHLFPLFLLWTAYCSILKVPLHVSWVVLSYPACTAAIWSSVGSGWAHTFDVGREGGEDRQTLWCCFIYSFQWFPSVPTAVINLKRAFFHPEIVSMRPKKRGEKNLVSLQTESGSQHVVLMWPTLARTGESSNCQAEREVCVCVPVCLCACVLCKIVMLVGREMCEFRYLSLSAESQCWTLFSTHNLTASPTAFYNKKQKKYHTQLICSEVVIFPGIYPDRIIHFGNNLFFVIYFIDLTKKKKHTAHIQPACKTKIR